MSCALWDILRCAAAPQGHVKGGCVVLHLTTVGIDTFNLHHIKCADWSVTPVWNATILGRWLGEVPPQSFPLSTSAWGGDWSQQETGLKIFHPLTANSLGPHKIQFTLNVWWLVYSRISIRLQSTAPLFGTLVGVSSLSRQVKIPGMLAMID